MGAIRHKSVRPETVALLEIQTPSLTVTQTVLIEAKEGLTVTVSHENGWTRELVAASGDVRVYWDPACKDPAITFRLLPIAEEVAA